MVFLYTPKRTKKRAIIICMNTFNCLFDVSQQCLPLPYLHDAPTVSGGIRQMPEHFIVNEVLGFTPSGEGEHYLFNIQKRERNTAEVAQALARVLGVHPKCVTWSGLKDKHAVTTQWLGVHSPKSLNIHVNELNQALNEKIGATQILEFAQHHKKLRIGTHRANEFKLTVTNLSGDASQLNSRLENIAQHGVPNYFGEQRFGVGGRNLKLADDLLFKGARLSRQKKSLALSAARGFLFNHMVGEQLSDGEFETLKLNQVLMLDGTHSVFTVDDIQDAQERLKTGDVHPVQALLGQGSEPNRYENVQKALEKQGLKSQWRASRVIPKKMGWELNSQSKELTVQFELPRGAYATSVLRECVNASDVSHVR